MSGRNIDLGTFSWDISELEKQVLANKQSIDKYAGSLKEAKAALKDSSKEISDNAKLVKFGTLAQIELNNAHKAGTISTEQYEAETHALSVAIADSQKQIKDLSEAQLANQKIVNDSENATKALRLENNELNKMMAAGRTETVGNEGAYRDLNKELNALKIESKNLGAEMIILERAGKKGTDEYAALEAQFKDTSKKADDLNNQFKELDHSVGDNSRSVGDYKEQIKGAFSEIVGGFSQIKNGDVAGGFATIKTNISGVTGSLKSMGASLLANPFTIVIAALAGIALGFREVYKYNEEQIPKIKLIENAFGDLGEEADVLRQKINGVEETYGLSFERILNTVDSISSSGLATEVEALDAIRKGLSTAPDADEFLSKLDQAASKARQTGISLDQVLNLTKALQGTAIDSGAIYGGLEKAAVRLQAGLEKNTALVSAFGKTFTEDLLDKVTSGQYTTVDALEAVRKKGEEVGLSTEQQAELGKSLFGKLAANAGAYTEQLRLVGEAYKDQFADLTDLQKMTLKLSEENENLAKAKDEALKSDSIIAFKEEFSLAWKRIQVGFYQFLAGFQKLDRAVLGSGAYVRGLFKTFPDSASAAFSSVLSAFKELLTGIQQGGGAITKFFSGDFEGAKAEANKFINSFPTFLNKLKGIGTQFNKGIAAGADAERKKDLAAYDNRQKALADIARAEAAAEQNKSKKKGSGGTDDEDDDKKDKAKKASKDKADKAAEKDKKDRLKALEDEAKNAIEIQKNETEQKIQIAKLELAEYIRLNAGKLDSEKRLSDEKLQAQLKYFDEVKRLQQVANDEEQKAKEFEINQKINALEAKKVLSVNELEEVKNLKGEIAIIEREYAGKTLDLETETNAKKKEASLALVKQQNEDKVLYEAIAYQERILKLEEENANEFELQQEQISFQREEALANLENDRAEGLISLANYEAQKALIQNQYAEDSKKITEATEEAKMKQYADTFGGVASLLGEQTVAGKAAGIAQAGINTYQGITEVLKSPSVLPEPFATVARVVNIGTVLATGLGAVKKITSIGAPKASRGMLISGPSHGQGGVPIMTPGGMIEAEGDEIIINKNSSRMFASELSAINQAGGGRKLFAAGGVVSGKLAGIQKSIAPKTDYDFMAKSIGEAVANGAAVGTRNGSRDGIENLNSNIKIKAGANF